jgi:hypothetical protein
MEAPRLLAVLPDQQIPYHDADLHKKVLAWLRDNKPEELILSGDVVDFTSLSAHKPDIRPYPGWDDLQSGVDSAFRLLGEYADAAGEGCHKTFIPGNHEQRLERALLMNLKSVHGLRRGGEDAPVLTVRSLLRLDDLGYDWAGATGGYGPDYPHGQVAVTPKLAVRHGWLARAGAGATALKSLETLGYSVIVGHTHRQAIVHKTYHEIDGSLRTLQAVEAGTLARVQGGLGYAVAPDWTPGFATAWLHADGTFKTELATYVNGKLLWSDRVY